MKYIRTKDGRIIKFNTSDVEEEIAGIKYDILGFRLKMTMLSCGLEKEDIVKIVDTIKELCDCFIFTDEGCEPEILYEDDLPVFPTEESELYGAIWVKGVHNEPILKSVAKMNDKGELEML